MPWPGTSSSVLAGWYTKYQFGGRLVACPYITDISPNALVDPARTPGLADTCLTGRSPAGRRPATPSLHPAAPCTSPVTLILDPADISRGTFALTGTYHPPGRTSRVICGGGSCPGGDPSGRAGRFATGRVIWGVAGRGGEGGPVQLAHLVSGQRGHREHLFRALVGGQQRPGVRHQFSLADARRRDGALSRRSPAHPTSGGAVPPPPPRPPTGAAPARAPPRAGRRSARR